MSLSVICHWAIPSTQSNKCIDEEFEKLVISFIRVMLFRVFLVGS